MESLGKFEKPALDASASLANATVGLVSKAEFTRRRKELEQHQEGGAASGNSSGVAETAAGGGTKKKKRGMLGSALSFRDGLEAEDAGDRAASILKKAKFGKNPAVNTSMLYDREREAQLTARKQELAEEWHAEQARVKSEQLEVTYSYHDPNGKDGLKGHRNSVTITKGFTVQQFLDKCREQVPQLRACSSDSLIYVKEDIILPHSLTFHELITARARGKSGPLFNFDVHDDVRIGLLDHRVEKDESHPGKVMQRSVYERMRSRFPYSRFEVYDPEKKWDSYTIYGSGSYTVHVRAAN